MAYDQKKVELLVAFSFFYCYMFLQDGPRMNQPAKAPEGYKFPDSEFKWASVNHKGWKSHDGLNLATYSTETKNPKALVFIFPGYSDHGEHHARTAEYLAKKGYLVLCLDPAGAGHSEGLKGYTSNYNESMNDMYNWVKHHRKQHPNLKAFALSASMGANTALTISARHPDAFDGIIAQAAAVKLADSEYSWLRQIIDYIPDWIRTVQIGKSFADRRLCSDIEIDRSIKYDPIGYHGKIRAGTGQQYMAAMIWIQNNLNKITVPIFVMHGELDDAFKLEDSSQFLHDHVASKDKKIKIYQGEYHILESGLKKKEVEEDVAAWIAARV